MTTERDPRTHIVLSWLREDAHENPERMLLRALDEVDATPQRRSRWPARRFPAMNTFAKALVATAAVVALAVAGINLLPGSQTGTGGLPPAASPSPSPSPTAKPTPAPSLPKSGSIPAGTYRMGTGPTILVTVPAGWVSAFDGTSIRKHYDQPNEVSAVDMWSPGLAVFTDACHSADTEERIGPKVDDLISALRAQENSELADPVDATIAGIDGTRLQVSSPAGLDLSQCSLENFIQIWKADLGGWLTAGPDRSPSIVYVADTPAGRLHLTRPGPNPAATAADNAEAEAIWASLEYVE
jgi:hypothetical protein